jgi:hypothetical protein
MAPWKHMVFGSESNSAPLGEAFRSSIRLVVIVSCSEVHFGFFRELCILLGERLVPFSEKCTLLRRAHCAYAEERIAPCSEELIVPFSEEYFVPCVDQEDFPLVFPMHSFSKMNK